MEDISRVKELKISNIHEKDTEIVAPALWKDQPVLIQVIRRPGCKLCRKQAQELNNLRPELERRGIKLIGISFQDNSISEFEHYFGSKDIYFDKTQQFYKLIWDGKVSEKGPAGIFHVAFWRNYKAAKGIEGNFKGDGYNMGGLLLIGKGDEGIKWIFKEEHFGDKPTKDALIKAIDGLVPMQQKMLNQTAVEVKKEAVAEAKKEGDTPTVESNNAIPVAAQASQ